jgi:hypothetical protein
LTNLFARGRQIASWDQQIWAHVVDQWIAPNSPRPTPPSVTIAGLAEDNQLLLEDIEQFCRIDVILAQRIHNARHPQPPIKVQPVKG